MCVIAASPAGIRQPTIDELRAMWDHNPHGAGYMYARNGRVQIHKGFMTFADFRRAIRAENFSAADPVVYHFRISTQAGHTPAMTHPFPLSPCLEHMAALGISGPVGVAHNGIIDLTSDPTEKTHSDTALFVAQYMTKLIRNPRDITSPYVKSMILELTNSKWAILDASGKITTIGEFTNHNGILLSNTNHLRYQNYNRYWNFTAI